LCHESGGTCLGRSFNQVTGAFITDSGIAWCGFSHAGRIEGRRQIRELMNDNVRPSLQNRGNDSLFIENINDNGVNAQLSQGFCLCRCAGCPEDPPALGYQ
jgi:hypothetical protein